MEKTKMPSFVKKMKIWWIMILSLSRKKFKNTVFIKKIKPVFFLFGKNV